MAIGRTKCAWVVAWCVIIITPARGDEPALDAGTTPAAFAPADVAGPWTAAPLFENSVGQLTEPLPAYSHLRLAQHTCLFDSPAADGQPLPSGELLPGLENLPELTAEPIQPSWPENDVRPRWRVVPGSRNGTNPAANIRSLSVFNEFDRLEHFGELNATVLRLRHPFADGRGGLTFDLPYVYVDPDFADGLGGIADLNFRLNYNFFIDQGAQWTYFPLLEFYIPTKDEDWFSSDFFALHVGLRRFVLGPGIGLVWTPDPQSFAAWLFRHEFDVAGNSGGPVNRSIFQSIYMRQWENGAYIMPAFTLVRDYEHRERNANLSLEVGVNVNTITYFTEPGIGLEDGYGELDWGFILGVRVNY